MDYESTVLALSGMGVPPYSARGLQQSLTPIPQATALRRTVNATLVNVGETEFRKYASTITGADIDPPAIDGIWPGLQLTVDCIVELSMETNTETESGTDTDDSFERPAVPGSIRHEAGFTFYRPRLVMLVTGFTVNRDEWRVATDWTLTLEEV